LANTLKFNGTEALSSKTPIALALIPLTMYVFSVLGSIILDKVFVKIGR